MIGRKILERIDKNLLTSIPHTKNEATALTIAGLQINTGHVLRSSGKLVTIPKNRHTPIISTITHTPNTSLTFGKPNPTTILPPIVSPMSGSSGASLRRQQRYSRAEQALASSLRHCAAERSPQELQIRALEQATALLSARAQDAQDHATMLRSALSDREIDPESYTAYQRERWMLERRQSAVTTEVKELSQQLASLKVRKGDDRKQVTSERVFDNAIAKRRANLARFFELSPTRTPFGSSHKDTRFCLTPQFSRRMTMSDVSPMRLRPSSVVSPIHKFVGVGHCRSLSLGGKPPLVPPRSSKRPPQRGSHRISLTMVAEDGPQEKVLEISSTTTTTSTPPLSAASDASSSSSSTITASRDDRGMATIYAPVMPRSAAEILAEVMDEVEIPSYARSLLEDFDLIHDEIKLPSMQTRAKRQAQPVGPLLLSPHVQDNAPPSEESDTGPYTSFAIPSPMSSPSLSFRPNLPFQTPPQHQHASLSLDYSILSTPSSSAPNTPNRRNASPSRNPLLSFIHGRKEPGSPASSRMQMDGSSSIGSKRRFTFFSRK